MTLKLSLPPKGCSPNYRGHWRRRHADIKTHREEAWIYARSARPANFTPVPVIISAIFDMARRKGNAAVDQLYRPLDTQNAIGSLKAAVDGLVDAGIVPSDSHEWVSWGPIILNRAQKSHGGRCGVTLLIEEA